METNTRHQQLVIQVILLDIEGTTCPVDFVAKTLFPYAQAHLMQTLERGTNEPRIANIIQEAIDEWHQDLDPSCQQMLSEADQGSPSNAQLAEYLNHLIKSDRKSSALKELQGIIWKQGYESSELKTPLFDDVLPSLDAWIQKGITLAVYSSGSVQAQKLLYMHTKQGNISDRFSHWFDTRTGPKLKTKSYRKICQSLNATEKSVLFISDHPGECDAAHSAGLRTNFCYRPGNPHQNPGQHRLIQSFRVLMP